MGCRPACAVLVLTVGGDPCCGEAIPGGVRFRADGSPLLKVGVWEGMFTPGICRLGGSSGLVNTTLMSALEHWNTSIYLFLLPPIPDKSINFLCLFIAAASAAASESI